MVYRLLLAALVGAGLQIGDRPAQAQGAGAPQLRLAAADGEELRPPPPPETRRTVDVCQDEAVPDCHPTVEAAVAAVSGGGLHIRVHCGTYRGGEVDLAGRSDVWIEGVPCADGALPRIELPTARSGYWVHLRPVSDSAQQPGNLRVERLQIVGERKAAFRLISRGPVVVSEVDVSGNGNGVQISSRAGGDYWVIGSRFAMNGRGEAGTNHHVYASCKAEDCRLFVLDSHFGGLHSGTHSNCSNQIRIRAREALIVRSVFDAREGCVSRLVNASHENRRLRIVDSVLIQGATENAEMVNTPPGDEKGAVLEMERVVAVSLRHGRGALIDYKGRPEVRLKEVLVVRPGGCPGGYTRGCLFDDPPLTYLNPTVIEDTRSSQRLADLPDHVRALLLGN